MPSAEKIRGRIYSIQLQLVEISARLDASPLNSFVRAVLEMSSIELKQELDYCKGYLAKQTGDTIEAIEQELNLANDSTKVDFPLKAGRLHFNSQTRRLMIDATIYEKALTKQQAALLRVMFEKYRTGDIEPETAEVLRKAGIPQRRTLRWSGLFSAFPRAGLTGSSSVRTVIVAVRGMMSIGYQPLDRTPKELPCFQTAQTIRAILLATAMDALLCPLRR